MPKSAAERAANYDAKVSSSITKNRIDAQRDNMVSNATVEFGALADVENAAQAILDGLTTGSPAHAIPTIDYPAYYTFVRKCYSLAKKFSGAALNREASIWGQTYADRGYDRAVLVALADQIFSITLTLT